MLESLVNLYGQMGGLGAGICLFILILFIGALYTNILLRRRYSALSEELAGFCAGAYDAFHSDVLQWITEEYAEAAQSGTSPVNTSSIIDTGFQAYLKPYLTMERFLKKAAVLMIATGLFGTFVGLAYAVGDIRNTMADTSANALIQDTGSNTVSVPVAALQGMAAAFFTSLVGTGFSIIHMIIMAIFSYSGVKNLLASQLEEYLSVKVSTGINAIGAEHEKQEQEKDPKATDATPESARVFETAIGSLNESVKSLVDFNDKFSANVGGVSESAVLLGKAMDKTSETIYESGVRIYNCTEALKAITSEISAANRRTEGMASVLAELKRLTEDSKKDRELFLKTIYEIPDRLLNYHEAAVAGNEGKRVK